MEAHNIRYNSDQEKLINPEYGRHVQLLIEHAKTIEDEAERLAFMQRIIVLMEQVNPQQRQLENYEERLWRDAFRIGEYDLNVVPPVGVVPTAENTKVEPEKVPYPVSAPRFRHYGHNVQVLIKQAKDMEDGPVKNGFIGAIASYMKLAYQTWNNEPYVSDETIKNDLLSLSGGALELQENETVKALVQHKPKSKLNNKGGRNNNGKRRNNSGGRNKGSKTSGGRNYKRKR